MDGQYRHCAYCNPGLVENKEISTNICIKYARFCSIFMFEISFEQRHVPLPSFTQRNINQYQRHKIPALFRMKLTSTPSHPRSNQYILLSGNLTSFAEEFCSFRLIFQISTRQSWIKFMYHFDGNMAQNRTFHHLPHFFQK